MVAAITVSQAQAIVAGRTTKDRRYTSFVKSAMHRAAIANAAGADFLLLGPRATMLQSPKPVVAVCAVRTGAGKSQVSRRIVQLLRSNGLRVAVVRHPMPYGDLSAQRVQRFSRLEDLQTQHCTIEEVEEYEPHIVDGSVVFAGVDYADILEQAASEADVILWDGGNNDLPFYRPTLHGPTVALSLQVAAHSVL